MFCCWVYALERNVDWGNLFHVAANDAHLIELFPATIRPS